MQEREFEGERYILAQGPALAAGSTLSLTFSGLPHHSPIPRRVALALTLLIVAGFAWQATRRPSRAGNAARVKQLTAKREKLFGELVRLEQQRRAGGADPKHAERGPRSSHSSNASIAIWTPRAARTERRERRLPRTVHPRTQP